MPFQIHALPAHLFAPLFELSDQDLLENGACRVIADANPGFPCHVSLQDAEIGDELILVNHQHLTGRTPYAASHAIYVRKNVDQMHPAPNQVPDVLASRLLSVRTFDTENMMLDADVIEGVDLADKLNAMFTNLNVAFIDIHNARQGCFAAKATRAT